jgi:hypothetical protein
MVPVGFYGATVLIGCMACSNTAEGADRRDGTGDLFLGNNREFSGSRLKQRSLVAQLVRRCTTYGSSSDNWQEQLEFGFD